MRLDAILENLAVWHCGDVFVASITYAVMWLWRETNPREVLLGFSRRANGGDVIASSKTNKACDQSSSKSQGKRRRAHSGAPGYRPSREPFTQSRQPKLFSAFRELGTYQDRVTSPRNAPLPGHCSSW